MSASHVASAGIVHETDRAGSFGYVTKCLVLVAKTGIVTGKPEGVPAKLSYGQGHPTSPLGWLCKICYRDEK